MSNTPHRDRENLTMGGVPLTDWAAGTGAQTTPHPEHGAPSTGGLKFDVGKLPAHLLAPEVFTSNAQMSENCVDDALIYIAKWWSRSDEMIGDDSEGLSRTPLECSFVAMLNALDRVLGGSEGNTCALALEAICRVLAFGANKYAARNWEKGIAYSRCYGAVFRHVWAVQRGEEFDPETGEHHFAHAACELMFLLAFEARGMGESASLDDRPDTRGPAHVVIPEGWMARGSPGVPGPIGCGGHAVGAQAAPEPFVTPAGMQSGEAFDPAPAFDMNTPPAHGARCLVRTLQGQRVATFQAVDNDGDMVFEDDNGFRVWYPAPSFVRDWPSARLVLSWELAS